MNPFSIQEINTLLSEPSSRIWNEKVRTAIVILWGLLIYPKLDPDLANEDGKLTISFAELYHLFKEYFGNEKELMRILTWLKTYDYIRFVSKDQIGAGTELMTSVDATKMYPFFRQSVLSRQIYQSKNQHPE